MSKFRQIRVEVVGSGKEGDPFRVDLPTYAMIAGTEKYKDPERKVLKSVEVLVPADECDKRGRLSKARIRAKYKGQKRWDHDDVLKDVQT